MFCYKCGSQLVEGAKFCSNCGANVNKVNVKRLLPEGEEKSVLVYVDGMMKIFDKVFGKDFPEVVLAYSKKDRGEEYKWCRSYMAIFKKLCTIENISLFSEKAEEDFAEFTTFFRKAPDMPSLAYSKEYLTGEVLYCVIKKNGMSDAAVKNFSLQPLLRNPASRWSIEYLDIIKKITQENLAEFMANPEEGYNFLREVWIPISESHLFEGIIAYVLDKAVDEIKPTYESNFGAIELCEYISSKYGIKNFTQSAIGYVNYEIYSISNLVLCRGDMMGQILKLPDGRKVGYDFYYYQPKHRKTHCYETFEIKKFEDNPRKMLEEIIEYIETLKKKQHGDRFADPDFDIDVIKKARDLHYSATMKHKTKQELEKEQELRNTITDLLTQPSYVKGEIKGATCPNCGRTTVKKISDGKRIMSIGLLGLASKNIGKTMECYICGYKW